MEKLQNQPNAYFKLKAIRPTNLARNFPHSNPIPNFGHMPADKYLVQKTSWYVSPFEGCTLENCTNDNATYNNSSFHNNTPDDNTINCQFLNCNVNDNNQSLDDCPDCLYLENLEAQKQLEIERANLANAKSRGFCFGCNTNTDPNDNGEKNDNCENIVEEDGFDEKFLTRDVATDEKEANEKATSEKASNDKATNERASNERATSEKATSEKPFYQRAFGGCAGCRCGSAPFDGEKGGVGEDQGEHEKPLERGSSFGREAPLEREKTFRDKQLTCTKAFDEKAFDEKVTSEKVTSEKVTSEKVTSDKPPTEDKAVGNTPRANPVGFSSCINCCGMSNRVNHDSNPMVDNNDNSVSVTKQIEVNDVRKAGVSCNNPFKCYDEKTKFIKQVFANASPISSFENNFSKVGDSGWDYGSGVINFNEDNTYEKDFNEREANTLNANDERVTNEKKPSNDKQLTSTKASSEITATDESPLSVEEKISHLDRAVKLQDEEMQLRYQVTESLTKALLDMPVDDYIRVIKSVLDEVSTVAPK